MEKRYQVFISSTFQDLQPARQEVSQALLRADCFPAGMELFPAADEEQFEFIKQIIDQSDYYIIISAGRYGSIHPDTGLSYTEMEYDYAVETGKPVIRLLHKDPFNELKGEFIETTSRGRKALESFRLKMQSGKLVKFWNEPKELGAEVAYSLLDCQKRFYAEGWIRASDHQLEFDTHAPELADFLPQFERIQNFTKLALRNLNQLKAQTKLTEEQFFNKYLSRHPEEDPDVINSPMVGTVYLNSEPGAQNFANIGDQIKEGQTILIIEAMKTMNQIPAPKSGTLVEIFVEDGQPVEFAAPLYKIA